MAQAGITMMSVPSGSLTHVATPTADELLEMQQYDRIVKFRDSILSGGHPSITGPVPAIAAGKVASNQQFASQTPATAKPVLPNNQSGMTSNNLHAFRANAQQPAIAISKADAGGAQGLAASNATQIDPLLLTKSEPLIKAELRIQRQKLERALRDEIDAQRAANKSQEQASDLDLSDILAKALTLVQATAPPLTDVDMAANASVSSDSFDDNTFYSSQHDTPEPLPQPQSRNALGDVSMRVAASSQPRTTLSKPASSNPHDQPLVPSPFLSRAKEPEIGSMGQKTGNQALTSAGNDAALQAAIAHDLRYSPTYDVEIPSLGRTFAADSHALVFSSDGSGLTSRLRERGNADFERRADHSGLQTIQPPLQSHQFGYGAPPLVRAHNLSPYAPQPSHVSPLATARQQPIPEPEVSILQGAPAPVAHLRQEQGNGTSPESSPQGGKGIKKKNKKKNKRKAQDAASTGRPGSPYIKPEPRSPSPFTSPQFARPLKRQRPSNRSQHEPNYDDTRGIQPVEVIRDDPPPPPRPIREYERVYNPYPAEVRYSVAPGGQRTERPVYEERRVEEPVQYVRRVQSPIYAPQYAPNEARPMRSATYSIADPIHREAPAYQREGRMSVRPVADRARSRSPVMVENRLSVMAPPPTATRIYRDEFGREYLEPPRPAPPTARYPAAPPTRLVEPEVLYEQALSRAATRLPGPETFERDGVLYRRASPAPAARRVVTQPEYGSIDHRDYRQRDYSARSGPGSSAAQEFIQYRNEARPQEVVPDYGMRAASVRPTEPIRYEYPTGTASVRPDMQYPTRVASVHPDAQYPTRIASVHPDAQYPTRVASVRPDAQYPTRVASTRPDAQYPTRVASIRPDGAIRGYAASVHPELHRDAPAPVYREYSVLPVAESELPPHEYSVRPVERYYDNRPVVRDDEVQYLDQPRTIQREVIYEDGRREVYR